MLPTPMPVVLGHEGAGIVKKVGRGISMVKAGDNGGDDFNSCGHCPSCQDHHISYCHEFLPRNFFATRADGTSALSKGAETVHGNFFGSRPSQRTRSAMR